MLKQKQIGFFASATLLLSIGFGCTVPSTTDGNSTDRGSLSLVANGEDFIRQGFTTKDGWKIVFDRAIVTVANIQAYQTEPPFNPEEAGAIKAQESVTLLNEAKTVDLAAGDEDAEPIVVAQTEVPLGMYNALTWELEPEKGESARSIILEGQATKSEKIIQFTLKFDPKIVYTCGQYVGDQRKGVVSESQDGEVEITFHFDHLFGDADVPLEESPNSEAVGFEPFAALAKDGTLNAELTTLQTQLDPATYQLLENALDSLGHVGEGHCRT
ncbi:DUF4382 domain-containing protein [Lusitaniella coriacea LEGE 07157]|uniref:DUF4382 domain-containing protein n=1 Tax=Lusitaniella coriacea LEGE 07157 TaxID=945747 RepID=A0A8J7E0E3_9CYAN|nr:DUF4382 domain-containing protein [Lusitaniella coriacea]MBE9117086.1 DUF4382 domain-containing protein [Lusitaniella coriacea LEGE 07157]